ncbi:S-layer homology domain-containing protein [Priestia koreensis]|uniref:S-layer homology domain-containing protein n=1 Tax=Priestia koreensis TaxID=284581 RepID=UPI00203FE411|nr:S-layer homology domain-containing protein [Priestia koreensis]MCM3004595.1 S-layer homology domain-containing protein [Priestia koreensis]
MRLKRQGWVWLGCAVVSLQACFVGLAPKAQAAVPSNMQVSPGVTYTQNQSTINSYPQTVRALEINTQDTYTGIDVSVPSPLNKVVTTSKQAIADSRDGHRVVGAVNGGFFDMVGSRLPMYLISYNNQIVNSGIIASSKQDYVNIPVAFGMTKDNKPQIDSFNLQMAYTHNGTKYDITGINKIRNYDDLILYTPEYGTATNSNKFGLEVVLTGASKNKNLSFGDMITATVQKQLVYGESATIPADGLVLSANGASMPQLKNLKPGDNVSISLGIDDKWKNSKFMLASGPMLVNNGKVDVSMDLTSDRATQRTARTAVAIDKTMTKVFFVTVDSRQTDSKGMSMKEFAQYLVNMGAYKALNFDGGGSTAMVVRNNGDLNAALVNKPSDGHERAVSTTLQVISSAPVGKPSILSANVSASAKVAVGASVNAKLNYVLDQYYSPLSIDNTKFSVVSNTWGTGSGQMFTAQKAGSGYITVAYGNATKNLPITIVDQVDKLAVSPASITMTTPKNQTLSAKAYDETGKEIIFNPQTITWNVSNNLGTVSKDGVFQPSGTEGSGEITATYGNTVTKIPVTIGTPALPSKPVVLDTFESVAGWTTQNTRAASTLSLSTSPSPNMEGKSSAHLHYDFDATQNGTAASYLVPAAPLKIEQAPQQLGMWVYGDGNKHWLRGSLSDGSGQSYTVNFTEAGGLDWKGWKYVKASVPTSITGPVQLQQLYVTEPESSKQGSGDLYFDKLKAIYGTDDEPVMRDIPTSHPYATAIQQLMAENVIAGYDDGEFKPSKNLTRLDAALLLVRALNLDVTNVGDVEYTDVPKTYRFYPYIAAITKAGVMNGKANSLFDPNSNLKRAEMAVILQKAFKLSGTTTNTFSDVRPGSFGESAIQALIASNITVGYTDGTFRPGESVTRGQYSLFLYRALVQH